MRSVLTTDGITLALHEHGGEGRPTLLCHATGLHAAVWEPLSAALEPGFERWAVDFRAHGASVVPAGQPLPWSAMADDVLAVLDDLGQPPGELLGIGHSMGGAALLLAEQARPGTFAGCGCSSPSPHPPGRFRRSRVATTWPRARSADGPRSRPTPRPSPTTRRSPR